MKPSADFSRLIEIMAALRDPETGCPWDVEQDFKSISTYTIEEAYEVADAIERQDFDDLCAELGDLILQPVFHAQMAAEAGHFSIDDVILSITEKLVRRHPHVFGAKTDLSSDNVLTQWEDIKSDERRSRSRERGDPAVRSLLSDVPLNLPGLMRAEKLAKRAAKVGFDWAETAQVVEKCAEELGEVEVALASNDKAAVHEEIGDLLFAVANLARKAGIAPEAALADANAKFVRRFKYVEQRCEADGVLVAEAGLKRLDGYWNEIRAADHQNKIES